MKHSSKTVITTLGLLSAILMSPNASAAKLYIDLPGITIGFHDDHRYKDNHHRSNKHYRSNDRHYKNNRKYRRHNNNEYYYDRSNHSKKYDRRYSDNYSYDNSYSNSGRYDRNYYQSNRSQVCPVNGYTPRYDRNRNCYKHKGHFHCS